MVRVYLEIQCNSQQTSLSYHLKFRIPMITVIIPALNEEKTIASVIQFCLADPNVSQVIVVDDRSEDETVAIARSSRSASDHQ